MNWKGRPQKRLKFTDPLHSQQLAARWIKSLWFKKIPRTRNGLSALLFYFQLCLLSIQRSSTRFHRFNRQMASSTRWYMFWTLFQTQKIHLKSKPLSISEHLSSAQSSSVVRSFTRNLMTTKHGQTFAWQRLMLIMVYQLWQCVVGVMQYIHFKDRWAQLIRSSGMEKG